MLSMNKAYEELGTCVPFNIEFTDVGATTATFKWNTKETCHGFVQYGNNRAELSLMAIEDSQIKGVGFHSVTLRNLKPRTIYYFTIVSNEREYGLNGLPVSVRTNAY